MEDNISYENDAKVSRIEIIEELFTKSNVRKAFLFLILYFVFGFIALIFLIISFYFFLSITNFLIFIPIILTSAYLFLIGLIYFESILFYTFINTQASISDAMKVLSRLGLKWFITPFLIIYSSIHCWNLYMKNYGLNIFVPFSKPNISVSEWRNQTSSLIFTIMAMKGCSVNAAIDDLFQLQKKYADFLFKKGIEYRFLFPIMLIVLLFALIVGGVYSNSFILNLLNIPFNSDLYNLVFSLGFVLVPFFVIMILWIFLYGTRDLIFVKLYSNEHASQPSQPQSKDNMIYQQI